MLSAAVLAAGMGACTGKPGTNIECGARINKGHVEVVGSQEVCAQVADSIGPRVSEALLTGAMPASVPVVEENPQ